MVTSRFGGIPKSHQPRKIQLILHPKGKLINDMIEPELHSLTYTSVDHIVQTVLAMVPAMVPWTKMANFDKSAYRLIPVHPDKRPLLGMK